MDELEHLFGVGLALAIGFLIGVERGWHNREQQSGRRAAGIRTFTLIGLFGGVAAQLSTVLSDLVLVTAFVGVLALTVAGYILELRQDDADRGLTTEVAMLITFALGAYAVVGDRTLAGVAAVVTIVLLRLKPELHRLVATIDRLELNSAIRLLVMSVVILPLLPNRGFGPGDVINPFDLWWMVVLISTLSYVGYFAIKFAGPRRGPIMGGLLGGLASSTATTLGFSRMVRRDPGLAVSMAIGIDLACTIMFVRIVIVAGVLDLDLALRLIGPLGAMALALIAVTAVVARIGGGPPAGQFAHEIGDPADIPAALKFGVLLLALEVASHFAEQYFGASGIYGLAIVAGLADVDAITLTLAQTIGEASVLDSIARAITLAAISNTVVKAVMAGTIGGRVLAVRVMPALGAAAVLGIIFVAIL